MSAPIQDGPKSPKQWTKLILPFLLSLGIYQVFFFHKEQKPIKNTGNSRVIVMNLTRHLIRFLNCFLRGMWKSLELQAREVLQSHKKNLIGDSDGSLEDWMDLTLWDRRGHVRIRSRLLRLKLKHPLWGLFTWPFGPYLVARLHRVVELIHQRRRWFVGKLAGYL